MGYADHDDDADPFGGLAGDAEIAAAVAAAEAELGETGRVLLRPSGTEPLVRVTVEAAEQAIAQRIAEDLAEVVRTRLGAAG